MNVCLYEEMEVKNKRLFHVIIILQIKLFLLCGVIECDLLCTSGGVCPPNKPFCTNRGCVFKCPSSAYINGTKCVAECGSLFVLNKTCVNHCPIKAFFRETPKLIGREIYIEKLCTMSCSGQEYLFNATCVHACPVTHRYINGRDCARTCEEDQSFMRNFTINEIIFHDCVSECEHLSEDGYCTEQCSDNKTIFDSICISSCPSSHPFVSGQHCVQNCPNSTVQIANNTCLSKCPLNTPYRYNDSCVSHCPKDFNKILENGMWHCIKQCSKNMFVHNQTCVWNCPNGAFINNKTCGTECSTYLPFLCEVQDYNECGSTDHEFTSIYPKVKYTICVEYCPKNTLVLDSACVTTCPSNYKYFNTSCVKSCPSYFPYVYNETVKTRCNYFGCNKVTIKPTCSEECPVNTYSYNKTCHHVCPVGLYTVDRKCMSACTQLKYLKQHRILTFASYHRSYAYWKEMKIKRNITECVSDCGDDNVIYNLTCAKRCPEKHIYVTNGTCHEAKCETEFMKNISLYIQCLDTCEGEHFVYNRTCTENCPEDTFVFNRTCVSECPSYSPFVLHRTIGFECDATEICVSIKQYSECESECPTGTYILNNTCFPVCPGSTFVLENKCVYNCTAPHQYHQESTTTFSVWHKQWNRWSKKSQTQKTKLCVDKCSETNIPKVYNLTCYEKCPKGTYSLNNRTCVQECPDEKPLKFTGHDTWMCIHSCADGEVFENGDCRYSCTNNSFAYDGKCINRCPEGYFWWYYTCNSRTENIIASVLFLGIDIIIVIFGKKILKEYFVVVGKFLCSHRTLHQHQDNADVKELKDKDDLNSNSLCDTEMDERTVEHLPLLASEESVDEDIV